MNARFKITTFYRWYDLWVGVFIDRHNETVYICPLPTLGVKIERGNFVKRLFECVGCKHRWLEKVHLETTENICPKCSLFAGWVEDETE